MATALKSKNPTRAQIIKFAETMEKVSHRIDIVQIASYLSVDVYATNHADRSFNAFIQLNKETQVYEIYVNRKHSKERQRFSIAHELSHLILHQKDIKNLDLVARNSTMNSLDREKEKAADELAGEILMPKRSVERFLKKIGTEHLPLSRDTIARIANYFRVSNLAAIIRLRTLGYYIPYTIL